MQCTCIPKRAFYCLRIITCIYEHSLCDDCSDTFLCSGEEGEVSNKKQLIETARLIVKESDAVVRMAKKVAEACTDKRMKRVSSPLQLIYH